MIQIKIKNNTFTIPKIVRQDDSLTIVDWLAIQYYETKDKIYVEPLVNTITPYIHKVANSFCKDKEDAKELSQELKIDLVRLIFQWKPKKAMRFNYLMRNQLYNRSCNFVKKLKKNGTFVNIEQKEILNHPNFIKNDLGKKIENKDLIQKLIASVNTNTKQVLALFLNGNNYEQIGQRLQITGVTVRNKIKKCKPIVQKLLGGKSV
jgi:RNA polymerase sigma-70 factor (ECF subfamily)